MYECSICQSLNHASRLHCQNCGTIPRMYSMLGVPMVVKDYVDWLGPNYVAVPVVVAQGAQRASQHHASRVYLRTVALDYYAE